MRVLACPRLRWRMREHRLRQGLAGDAGEAHGLGRDRLLRLARPAATAAHGDRRADGPDKAARGAASSCARVQGSASATPPRESADSAAGRAERDHHHGGRRRHRITAIHAHGQHAAAALQLSAAGGARRSREPGVLLRSHGVPRPQPRRRLLRQAAPDDGRRPAAAVPGLAPAENRATRHRRRAPAPSVPRPAGPARVEQGQHPRHVRQVRPVAGPPGTPSRHGCSKWIR